MEPYQDMYYSLFNSVTDAIEQLMRLDAEAAIRTLMDAQQQAEERYISFE